MIGEEALDRFDTFGLTDAEKKVLQTVIDAFENFCTPKANESVDRHIFFTRKQQSGETFSSFITELRKLSSVCGFGALRDSLIKDSVIIGVLDQDLKTRLLREDDLDLEKCINICKAAELLQTQLKTLENEAKVNLIKTSTNKNQPKQKKKSKQPSSTQTCQQMAAQQLQQSQQWQQASSKQQFQQMAAPESTRKPCHRCNKFHPINQCPAWGKKCSNCGKMNHFAQVCKNQSVNFIQNQNETFEVESMFIGNISLSKQNEDWCEMLR